MKKLFKLFTIAMLAMCGVACTPENGEVGNNNGGGQGDTPTTTTFTIDVTDITGTSATVSVTPSTDETYYFDIIEKAYFDTYATEAELIADCVADLQEMIDSINAAFGTNYTFADVVSSGGDSYTYEEGDLEPNTDYYAFAFYLSANGEVKGGLTKKAFKTLNEVATSENTFQVEVSNISATGATVSVTPSNHDTYYFDVLEKEIYDMYTDKKELAAEYIAEIKDYYESYGYSLADALSSGMDTYSFDGFLDPNTAYCALAFGVTTSGAITTDITTVEFTTLASGGGNTGGGNTGDKNLTCFEMGYFENWGDYYGTNALNWFIDLYSATTNDYFVLELQGDLSETAPVAGEYKLLSTFAAGTAVAGGVDADGYIYGTYWGLFDDNWESFVDFSFCASGTVKVGKSDDLYTIDIDALDENGNSIKLSYAGVLEEYVGASELAAKKLSNDLTKRFCTASRLMKMKQLKMAPKAAKKAVKLAPKKVVAPAKSAVTAPKSSLVKRNIAR